MSRGRLLVLEGLDGVGKTTASRALASCLGAVWTTTPNRTLRGAAEVRSAYRSADGMVLFYASSVLDRACEIRELLANGHDVVCDRYWLSTVAGAASRRSQLPLHELEAHVLPADVTVLLTLDEAARAERLAKRSELAPEDRASFEPEWAATTLRAMRSGLSRTVAGRGLEFDVTGLDVHTVTRTLLVMLQPLGSVVVRPPHQMRYGMTRGRRPRS
jgi:dTMP kinase